MKLKKFIIENFRSYNEPVSIPISDFQVFVGKNDAGKSTILEALDIFFNEDQGSVKWDKGDLNVHSGSNLTRLTAVFTDLPECVVIDSSVETTLQREYLLNQDGELEIIKTFNKSKPTTYINCLHPDHPDCSDLLSKKIKDLKALADKKHIKLSDKTKLDRLPSSVNGLSRINSASNNAILESGREAPYVQEIAVQRPDFC